MLKKIGIRNSLIYICCLLIVYFTFMFRLPVKTEVAEYTTYEDKLHFKGIYFANEEKIYSGEVESAGKLNIESGSKIGIGAKISDSIVSKVTGVLLYNLDGYENKYNLENIKSLNLEEMDKIIDNANISPGLKVIESESLYFYVFIEKDGSFNKGQSFYISLGNNKYMCKVIDIISKKEGNFLVLKLIEDINYKNLHRGITGDIIKSSHKGIVVPSNALSVKGDIYNVFVKMPDGYAELKTVDVLYDDGKNAVVIPTGNKTIQRYDQIIINPSRLLKNGTKVR